MTAAGVWVLAFTVRLVPVLRGGGLNGISGLDPAVYYAAAAGWVRGAMPYRDFLLLHPPAGPEALLPFAMLGQFTSDTVGMATARITVMAMGAATAVLVTLVLRHNGPIAALVGGLAYALYWPAINVERSTWLEALGSFLTAAGLLLVAAPPAWLIRARRVGMLACGACFGLACATKWWSALTLLGVLSWLALARRWSDLALVILGAATAIATALAPFVGDLQQLWQMTVLTQSGRLGRAHGSLLPRLGMISGLPPTWASRTGPAVVVMVAVAGLTALAVRERAGQLACILAASGGVILLTVPTWYRHYAAFIGVPVMMLIGLGFNRLLPVVKPARVKVAVATALAIGVGFVAVALVRDRVDQRFDAAALTRIAADHPGCVTTDDPNALILADLITPNFGHQCRYVVDLTGYRYNLGSEGPLDRNGRWQALYRDYIGSGDIVILMRKDARNEMDALTTAMVRSWPVVATISGHPVLAPG